MESAPACNSDNQKAGEEEPHINGGTTDCAGEICDVPCERMDAEHGTLGDALAEPYFSYGNALLQLGSMENEVLGNELANDDSCSNKSTPCLLVYM